MMSADVLVSVTTTLDDPEAVDGTLAFMVADDVMDAGGWDVGDFRAIALKFERGVDAAALAKGRHGFLPGKSRKNVAAFACMCDAVLARNAIEARYGFTAELRPLDGGEGR